MRTYHVNTSGEIAFTGDGGGVALRDHKAASAAHVAEVLQQTYDAGRKSMLTEIQEDLGKKQNGMPDELKPFVRSSTGAE